MHVKAQLKNTIHIISVFYVNTCYHSKAWQLICSSDYLCHVAIMLLTSVATVSLRQFRPWNSLSPDKSKYQHYKLMTFSSEAWPCSSNPQHKKNGRKIFLFPRGIQRWIVWFSNKYFSYFSSEMSSVLNKLDRFTGSWRESPQGGFQRLGAEGESILPSWYDCFLPK